MRTFLARHGTTIVVAAVTAMLTASTPTIAGVIADYARNSDKVDGKHAVGYGATVNQRKGKLVATSGATGRLPKSIVDLSDYQKRCRNGAVLAFARVDTGSTVTTGFSSSGVTEKFNCTGGGALVRDDSGADGVFWVRFPGVMDGFDGGAAQYIAVGNVEAGGRTFAVQRNTIDGLAALEVNIVLPGTGNQDNNFSVALLRVDL